MMLKIKIPEKEHGTRLDRCVRRLLGQLNQSLLEKFLRSGMILLDGKKAKSSTKVSYGQEINYSQKLSFDSGDEKVGTYQFLDSVQEALRWDEFPYPTKAHEHSQPYMPGSGGSEQECLTWIGNSNRQPLPGFGCFDFCSQSENARHATRLDSWGR